MNHNNCNEKDIIAELIDSYVPFLWLYPPKTSGILNISSVTLWLCCHGEFPGSFTQPLPQPQSVTMETFFLSRISLILTVARETISGIPISCPLQQTHLAYFFSKYVLVILHLPRCVGLCLSFRTKETICLRVLYPITSWLIMKCEQIQTQLCLQFNSPMMQGQDDSLIFHHSVPDLKYLIMFGAISTCEIPHCKP